MTWNNELYNLRNENFDLNVEVGRLREENQRLRSLLDQAKGAVGYMHLSVEKDNPLWKATQDLWDEIEKCVH